MGLFGGGNSSSKSTAYDNRTVTESGGLSVAGSDYNAITFTNQVVDVGILDIGSAALKGAGDVATSALTLANNAVENTLASNTVVTQSALDTSLDAMRQSLATSAAATQDAIAAANQSASTSASVSRDAMTNVSLLADKSQGYAWESAAEALGLTSSVIGAAFASADNMNQMSLATVKNVADAYQTARETEVTAQFQDYRYILIAGLVVVGIIGFQAVKK